METIEEKMELINLLRNCEDLELLRRMQDVISFKISWIEVVKEFDIENVPELACAEAVNDVIGPKYEDLKKALLFIRVHESERFLYEAMGIADPKGL